jgi:hypothetical protein
VDLDLDLDFDRPSVEVQVKVVYADISPRLDFAAPGPRG